MRLPRVEVIEEGESTLPLINVVFLLLIFFMIAGAIEKSDLFDLLPPQSISERQAEEGGVTILLSAEGQLALEDVPITAAELEREVAARLAETPGLPVRLKADGRGEAVETVALMEHLRRAGVKKLQLITIEAER